MPTSKAPSGTYEDLILSQAPALYWRLAEATGDVAADLSGHERHGTYHGTRRLGMAGPLFGDRSAAISLSGGGVVRSCYNPFTRGAKSFGGWARLDALRFNHALVGGTGNANRYLRQVSGTRQIEWSGVATFPDAVPGPGEWFHWVFVVNESNRSLSLYINGVLLGAKTDIDQQWGDIGHLQVGGLGGKPSSPWEGLLGEIAVWERALLPSEILAQHELATSRRFPRKDPNTSGEYFAIALALGPSLYWRLGEGSVDTSISDASGYGNDGFYGDSAGSIVIAVEESGAVDNHPSVRFRDPTPGGPNVDTTIYGRAYDYKPFKPNAAVTVVGLVKNINKVFAGVRPGNPFQTLFGSANGPGGKNDNCTLEVANNPAAYPTVRWYSNVNVELHAQVTSTDFPNAWPVDGTEWVHWAFSYDHRGGGARLWVNGVEQTREYNGFALPQDFQGTEGPFQIANRGDGSYEIWGGWMAEVAVYERVLSDQEIRRLSSAAAAAIRETSARAQPATKSE